MNSNESLPRELVAKAKEVISEKKLCRLNFSFDDEKVESSGFPFFIHPKSNISRPSGRVRLQFSNAAISRSICTNILINKVISHSFKTNKMTMYRTWIIMFIKGLKVPAGMSNGEN